MTLEELRHTKREAILQLAASYGASNVRVFGSLARSAHLPTSDIDFLVDLEPSRSLMDLGGLLIDLQEMLRTHVDVAMESLLRPEVREKVLTDAVPL